MGLEVDTSINLQAKVSKKFAAKNSSDNLISIFSPANINEHKTELSIVGGITTAGLISLSLLKRKKIPMSSTKPFSFFSARRIRRELMEFLEKDFMKQNQLRVKPNIYFSVPNTKYAIQGDGVISPFDNNIILSINIFAGKYYKIVDKTTGKCSVEAGINWQRTGPMHRLQSIIESENLENVIIVPLTRAERMKVLKSTAAHEAFHSMQYANMIMHPDIGLERIIEELSKYINVNDKNKQKIILAARKIWGELAKSGNKIDPKSELGIRTKKQFEDMINNAKKISEGTITGEDYVKVTYESEAYQKELEFAIKNNLLI